MRVHFSVFAAALLSFSEGKPVIQVPVPSDLIHNSSDVFDDDVSKHLPLYHRPTSSLPTLQPRQHVISSLPDPATDDVWNHYVRKGRHLMAQMVSSDRDAARLLPGPRRTSAQSPYGFSTLKRWGYTTYLSSEEYCDFGTGPGKLWGISPYLRSKKISYRCKGDEGNWISAVIKHWDPKKENVTPMEIQTYRGPDGKTRPVRLSCSNSL
ncbi:hypothetical protein BDU57DRAFT_597867 [Ampelomyces quisqualis]|uniref:Uncharacterized protein n=1 Tax=Ampelomyces quisqualis TaxID=50730 RepID=A0A6A5QAF6_AMPQU|nr:hypothetical protein BDU57DRAFT_597867 [Ampelomyces quisqualis]